MNTDTIYSNTLLEIDLDSYIDTFLLLSLSMYHTENEQSTQCLPSDECNDDKSSRIRYPLWNISNKAQARFRLTNHIGLLCVIYKQLTTGSRRSRRQAKDRFLGIMYRIYHTLLHRQELAAIMRRYMHTNTKKTLMNLCMGGCFLRWHTGYYDNYYMLLDILLQKDCIIACDDI